MGASAAFIKKYMGQALELARKAIGETFPNPLVGAVIVKSGKVAGCGFHKKAGGPHAEIFALKQAGRKARGATLFCTFEPCVHTGRTGPCVEAIKRAGIKEVYIGMVDPNPLNRGQGVKHLRQAGIRVSLGYYQDQIEKMNAPFITAMTCQRPQVTIKVALSLDGKTATRSGDSRWITSRAARRLTHRRRRFFDAIMVGVGTVIKDDPLLEPDKADKGHSLTKIIVDSRGRMPLGARLLRTKQKVIVASVKKNIPRKKALERRGVSLIITKPDRGRVDLPELLRRLHELEIRNLLVEGGSELIGSFCDRRLADRAMMVFAPIIIGGRHAVGSIGGEGISSLRRAIHLKNEIFTKIGDNSLIEGDLVY
jgi:diaminohydroxyphosphoribosylaminopyrimidine deaminase/5-amino-6-(5-phosphoribosylamino)uracil reductase